MQIVVSSAYNTTLTFSVKDWFIILTNKIKSNGDNTHLCGTPKLTDSGVEKLSLIFTMIFRSEKKE